MSDDGWDAYDLDIDDAFECVCGFICVGPQDKVYYKEDSSFQMCFDCYVSYRESVEAGWSKE